MLSLTYEADIATSRSHACTAGIRTDTQTSKPTIDPKRCMRPLDGRLHDGPRERKIVVSDPRKCADDDRGNSVL